jgi:hypothetical protein
LASTQPPAPLPADCRFFQNGASVFTIIHQIRRRRESLGAMLARGNDGTDSFARLNQTIAVYGEDAFVRSAGGRLTSGAGDLF